jgi:hypothetical protein
MGEAAGTAAHLSLAGNTGCADIAVDKLQETLERPSPKHRMRERRPRGGPPREPREEMVRHAHDERPEEAEDLEARVEEPPLDCDGRRSRVQPRQHGETDRRAATDRGGVREEREGAVDRLFAGRAGGAQ